MAAMSSTVSNSFMVRTRNSWPRSVRRPPDRLMFAACRRWPSPCTLMFNCDSRSWSTFDRDLVLEAAAHQDGGDAQHRVEALLDHVLGEPPEFLQMADLRSGSAILQHDRGAHDGIEVGVQAQDRRPLDVQRQLHEVELLAHLDRGVGHVRAPRELEHHVRSFRGRDRVHAAQAVDDADAFLETTGDLFLDFGRRRAFEIRAHGEGRVRQVRQEVQAEAVQGQAAEQRHRQGRHGHGDGPCDGGSDHAHCWFRCLRACSAAGLRDRG